jgi:hypothetical protein
MNDSLVHDALGRLAEVAGGGAARPVRITRHVAANRYAAQTLEFDTTGEATPTDEPELTVTNLAEPTDPGAAVPVGSDAVALDAEGRWLVFLRPVSPAGTALVLARIVEPVGGAVYTVRPQCATGPGTFADDPSAADLTAYNLAELSLGSGSAVDADTVVLVLAAADTGTPPTLRYVFDHPAYAKYLS